MYRGLVAHARRVLMGYFDLVRVCKGEGGEELSPDNSSLQNSEMSFARLE